MAQIYDVKGDRLQPLVLELAELLSADAVLVVAMTNKGECRMQVAGDSEEPAYQMLYRIHQLLLEGNLVLRHETKRVNEPGQA